MILVITLFCVLTVTVAYLGFLIYVVRRMHMADDAYGCGFYSDDDWLRHYKLSRSLSGMRHYW